MEEGHYAAGVQPGQILLGKYRIERVLGIGGMGVVVAATHVHLEDRVAIKFLLPQALENGEAAARFIREARAAVRIKSEHVARVSDVGRLENGAPYMVMEYLEGTDLTGLVKQNGPLPIDDAVEALLQACEAIAEAHALHIVHRDLKPANLFMIRRADGTPSVKVLDFGISKVGGPPGSSSDMNMTRTTAVMGSPLYMSPEQMASSRDVDARTDIWALGVILYEILTARMPFEAETMPQLCAMILQQPSPPIRQARPDTPEGLEQVILRCLEKDRERRFSTVAEFAHALMPYAPRRARASVERISRVISGEGYVPASVQGSPSEAPAALRSSARGTQRSWGSTSANKPGSTRFMVGAVVLAVLVGSILAAVKALHPAGANLTASSADARPLTADIAAARPAATPPASASDQMTIAPSVPSSAAAAATPLAISATAVPSSAAAIAAPILQRTPLFIAHSPAFRAAPKPVAAAAVAAAPTPATAPPAAKPKKAADVFDDRK